MLKGRVESKFPIVFSLINIINIYYVIKLQYSIECSSFQIVLSIQIKTYRKEMQTDSVPKLFEGKKWYKKIVFEIYFEAIFLRI